MALMRQKIKIFFKKITQTRLVKVLFGTFLCTVPLRSHKEKFIYVPMLFIYLETLIFSIRNRNLFRNLETFLIFFGYQRSGHSMLGALLDAHPNIIIAHEANTLGLIKLGALNKNQVFSYLLLNSKRFANQGRGWSGYSYEVADQYQGAFTYLKIIGDKYGGGSVKILRKSPEFLKVLKKFVGIKVKYVLHVRNPYDMISSMCRRRKKNKPTEQILRHYFLLSETIASQKKGIAVEDLFEGRHESLIKNPEDYLRKLCQFLNVSYSTDYLKRCAAVVSKASHKARYEIDWDKDSIQRVKSEIDKFDFLQQYSFYD